MPKYFSKSWGPILRFPAIFGGVLIAVGYGASNFKQLFSKRLEEGKEGHLKFADELLQRSKENREKEKNVNGASKE